MQPLEQIYIAGSSVGLRTDVKPFLQPDQAFTKLENAYVWRERIKKREGLEFVGRLRRNLADQPFGNTVGGVFNGNIITNFTLETTGQIAPGTITILVGFPGPFEIFTESSPPDGLLTGDLGGTGTINYNTGDVSLISAAFPNDPVTITFSYYPGLPVMGIWVRDVASTNDEQTVFFDTTYAYIYTSPNFDQFTPPSVTWAGTDSDFFWCENYRGADPSIRLFFATNFVCSNNNPMRYYQDGPGWVDFAPGIFGATATTADTNFLFSARLLISYYGRLVALNTWEGVDRATSQNFYNRARFCQIGNPLLTTVVGPPYVGGAWRSDNFGKGGFIDAPTNEAIISARFFKNTLIVGFERSTWQLRYVGEYGLPFIWERVSSDFGTESTFSTVLFDQGVLQVGDRAINSATSSNVDRIDSQIPDQVFDFRNSNHGVERIWGVRDFQKELVYWCYVDVDLEENSSTYKFPNKTLVYNYRNNTYAKFRNNVTAYGILQLQTNITWDSTDVSWDDEDVTWDDNDDIQGFPRVVSGNQQGYIHYYGYTTPDEVSLSISGVDLTTNPVQITVKDHNLKTDEWIGLYNSIWIGTDPELNGDIYQVSAIDENTLGLYRWDGTAANAVTSTSTATYFGLGEIALYPILDIETKDFNPYQAKGSQLKISYIDFLVDSFPASQVGVQLIVNNSTDAVGNLIVGNKYTESGLELFGFINQVTKTVNPGDPTIITSENHGLRTGDKIVISNCQGMTLLNNDSTTPTYTITYLTANTFSIALNSSSFPDYLGGGTWVNQGSSLYVVGSNYAWHRFFATSTGQFIRIRMFYDSPLMSSLTTHQSNWIMNAISLWVRPGSKNIL